MASTERAVRPIEYRLSAARPQDLRLGLEGRGLRVTFEWRAYPERSEAARADYDRLRQSIMAQGILRPVIAWQGHVLIGMRRVEIAVDLGIESVRVAEILEDVRQWGRDDLPRLRALQDEIGEVEYG